MTPKISRQYVVKHASLEAARSGFSSLHLESTPFPTCGESEVLVRVHAVCLNFRDLMVSSGSYIWPVKDTVVPCSDGAGEVVTTGSRVTRFQSGDRVAATFFQTAENGTLGADMHGMLREYVVVHETGLVAVPKHLTMEEASTLPCAGVTAWNALMGAAQMKAGDAVVVQGTGGVSMAAMQLALAAGAEVVATTSSTVKMEHLRSMGAHHVLNYREDPGWGTTARKLLNDGVGADFVVEIGGPATIEQSLKAVHRNGTIAVIGQRSGQAGGEAKQEMKLVDAFMYPCTMRRILVGSREQFEEMNRSIAVNKVRPIVDEQVFDFDDAPKAFSYLWEQKHFGNVIIRVVDKTNESRL